MTLSVRDQAEIARSAAEAAGIRAAFVSRPKQIARYMDPPAETSYPLEYAFHLLGDIEGKTVLDFGCGSGEDAVLLALRGACVIGIDLSPELIELAWQRTAANGVTVDFRVASAYDTQLADGSVDVVFSHAILHHLDLDLARREVLRVLRPGGKVILLEPMRDSEVIAFVRKLIPYQSNLVSEFEAPLTTRQLDTFCAGLRLERARRFRLPLLTVLELLPSRLIDPSYRLDRWLLGMFPFLARYASVEVRALIR